MDGVPILSAHVFSTGRVDTTTPGGITQENVRRVDRQFTQGVAVIYCFSGLPPVVGGQVTLDGLQLSGAGKTAYLTLEVQDCNPEVTIVGKNNIPEAADFHVLMY